MLINGKEMTFDIFDLDTAEKYEAATERVAARMQDLSGKDLGFSEGVRLQCEAVAECFDAIFGDGAAVHIFDGEINLKKSLIAFRELVDGAIEQQKEISALSADVRAAYAPNRAARRAQAK